MSKAKKAFIDERASLERPNRSLFIRNIDVNIMLQTFGINAMPLIAWRSIILTPSVFSFPLVSFFCF